MAILFTVFIVCGILIQASQQHKPIPAKCSLPADSGLCLAYFENYYYDNSKRDCLKFVYGGCGGNDNRFDTREQCRTACMSGYRP